MAIAESRLHRDKLMKHQEQCSACEAELGEIERELSTADIDDTDAMLTRQRVLADKLVWLGEREAALRQHAEQEQLRDRIVAANERWAPLAEERSALLEQLDPALTAMGELLERLDANTQEQVAVIATCRDLSQLRSSGIEVESRGATGRLRMSVVSRLGLLRDHPDAAGQLPLHHGGDPAQHGQTQARLLSVPPVAGSKHHE